MNAIGIDNIRLYEDTHVRHLKDFTTDRLNSQTIYIIECAALCTVILTMLMSTYR